MFGNLFRAIQNQRGRTAFVRFRKAVKRGADCPELFALRNKISKKSPRVEQANLLLRECGCYHAGAKRSS